MQDVPLLCIPITNKSDSVNQLSIEIEMKKLLPFVSFIFLNSQFYGQTIAGRVMSASDDKPLIYASVGVIGTSFGIITNEDGNFKLEVKGLPINSPVRFSMIGYKSQTSAVGELSNKDNIIILERETYKLPEVIVSPPGKLRKAGTISYTFRGGLCGWAGSQTGKGWEIGTKIELGDLPVRLKGLHIHVNAQSYDSTLFRLHIRNIIENMPGTELLKNNILLTLTKETGWIDLDLSKYDLVFDGDIILSLEWIKIIGMDMNKFITINGEKRLAAGVTFDTKRNQGSLFTKWGTEAKWVRLDDKSPSIYLTVQ
jgi:hypothetical protein